MGDGPVRVLWLVKGLGRGGAEQLLVSFAGATTASDIEYHCAYVVAAKDQLVPQLQTAGVIVHRLSRVAWPLAIRRLVAEHRIDVVHAHSPLLAVAARLSVRLVPGGRRPALVATEHNVPEAYHPLTRIANGLTFGLDDAHLAVSAGALRSAPARHRPEVEVVHHGVDLEQLHEAWSARTRVRQALGVLADDVVAVTVANYRVHKAWPDLLAAAELVLGDAANVRFVGIGQGPLADEVITRHAQSGLGDRFLLLGARDDVPEILAAADLFVLASVQEGLPVAVMEALAVGLPVVATSVGGVPEAIDDGVEGRLVPPSRPDLLAAAVLDIVRDPSRRAAMAVAAAERGEEFDIRRAVKRTEELYRALAAERR